MASDTHDNMYALTHYANKADMTAFNGSNPQHIIKLMSRSHFTLNNN